MHNDCSWLSRLLVPANSSNCSRFLHNVKDTVQYKHRSSVGEARCSIASFCRLPESNRCFSRSACIQGRACLELSSLKCNPPSLLTFSWSFCQAFGLCVSIFRLHYQFLGYSCCCIEFMLWVQDTAGNVAWANDNTTLFYVTKDKLDRPFKVDPLHLFYRLLKEKHTWLSLCKTVHLAIKHAIRLDILDINIASIPCIDMLDSCRLWLCCPK